MPLTCSVFATRLDSVVFFGTAPLLLLFLGLQREAWGHSFQYRGVALKVVPSQQSLDVRSESVPRSLLYLLLGAAVIKLGILLINGPSVDDDSRGYIAYANAILDHGRAFAPVVWGAEMSPPFIHDLPGYPLVLAGAKLILPAHYAFVIVVFQCVLNGAAIYLIFRVTERLLQSRSAALLVAVLYIFSVSVVWDNALMADSIYSSLFNIVVFGLLGSLLGYWRLTLGRSVGLAVLWGYSVLMRSNGLYFTALPIILTIAIAIRSEDRFGLRVSHFVVFVLVFGGMMGMYVMLNHYRTGEAFFSITGLKNWLQPIFHMVRYGYANPFTGDDLLSRTVRETMTGTDYGFHEQKRFLLALHERCQCTPTQQQSMVFAKYLWAISHYPIAYLRVVFVNFRGLATLLADPVATINQFAQIGTFVQPSHYSTRILPDPSFENMMMLAHNFSVTTFVKLFLATISKTISAIALLLVTFGTPIVILRKWYANKVIDDRSVAISFLWLAFMTVSLAFCMVHIERRYALPVVPAALVCLVYTLQWLRARLYPYAPKRSEGFS